VLHSARSCEFAGSSVLNRSWKACKDCFPLRFNSPPVDRAQVNARFPFEWLIDKRIWLILQRLADLVTIPGPSVLAATVSVACC
jgi:hypothetical protein